MKSSLLLLVLSVLAITGLAHAKPTSIRAAPMAGPFKTAKAACLAAPACGGTVYNDRTNKISGSPGPTRCTYWPESEPGEAESEPEPTTLTTPDALLASVSCAAPRGIRSSEEQYYLFIQTAAGWWRAPAFSFSYNDKYCGEEITATWETRGTQRIARVKGSIGCVACSKQGQQSDDLDLLIVAETARKRPVMYQPLVTGQHERQERDADGATDVDCPTIKTDVVLTETWTGTHALELTGPATWKKITRDRRGILLRLGADGARSSVGTYKLD